MNASQTINTFAATRNVNMIAASFHLNAFQLEGAAREFFLKDMYQIANETMNEMEGYDENLGQLMNQIAEYAK